MDNIDYKAKVGFVPAGDGGRVTIVLSFASESPSLLGAEACGAKNALVKDVPAKSGAEASDESSLKKDPAAATAAAAGTVDSDTAKAMFAAHEPRANAVFWSKLELSTDPPTGAIKGALKKDIPAATSGAEASFDQTGAIKNDPALKPVIKNDPALKPVIKNDPALKPVTQDAPAFLPVAAGGAPLPSIKEFPEEEPAPTGDADWTVSAKGISGWTTPSKSRRNNERKGASAPIDCSNGYGALGAGGIIGGADTGKAPSKGATVETTTTVTPEGSVSASTGWLCWSKFSWPNALCTVFICLVIASGGAFTFFSDAILPSSVAPDVMAFPTERGPMFAPFNVTPHRRLYAIDDKCECSADRYLKGGEKKCKDSRKCGRNAETADKPFCVSAGKGCHNDVMMRCRAGEVGDYCDDDSSCTEGTSCTKVVPVTAIRCSTGQVYGLDASAMSDEEQSMVEGGLKNGIASLGLKLQIGDACTPDEPNTCPSEGMCRCGSGSSASSTPTRNPLFAPRVERRPPIEINVLCALLSKWADEGCSGATDRNDGKQACAAEFATHDDDQDGVLSSQEAEAAIAAVPAVVLERLSRVDVLECIRDQITRSIDVAAESRRRLANGQHFYSSLLAMTWSDAPYEDGTCNCVWLAPEIAADESAINALPADCRTHAMRLLKEAKQAAIAAAVTGLVGAGVTKAKVTEFVVLRLARRTLLKHLKKQIASGIYWTKEEYKEYAAEIEQRLAGYEVTAIEDTVVEVAEEVVAAEAEIAAKTFSKSILDSVVDKELESVIRAGVKRYAVSVLEQQVKKEILEPAAEVIAEVVEENIAPELVEVATEVVPKNVGKTAVELAIKDIEKYAPKEGALWATEQVLGTTGEVLLGDALAVMVSGPFMVVVFLAQIAGQIACNVGTFPTCQRCAAIAGESLADCNSRAWALPHGQCPPHVSTDDTCAPPVELEFCTYDEPGVLERNKGLVSRAYCCSNPECNLTSTCGDLNVCACPQPKGTSCKSDDDCVDDTGNTERYCTKQNGNGFVNEGKLCYDGADGDSCDNDAQCKLNFKNYCYEGICYDGSTGDGCDNDADCQTQFPDNYCTWARGKMKSNKKCWSGAIGDACSDDTQCGRGLHCVTGECRDGCGGAPCEQDSDCLAGDVNSSIYTEDACDTTGWFGVELLLQLGTCRNAGCVDEVCESDDDCDVGLYCEPWDNAFKEIVTVGAATNVCKYGAEGDYCNDDDQCALSGNYCQDYGVGIPQCYDGSEDDPCGTDDDCASGLYCEDGGGSVIQRGKCRTPTEGSPCGNDNDCEAGGLYCSYGECHDGSVNNGGGAGVMNDRCEKDSDCHRSGNHCENDWCETGLDLDLPTYTLVSKDAPCRSVDYTWSTIPYCDVDSSKCCVPRISTTPCSSLEVTKILSYPDVSCPVGWRDVANADECKRVADANGMTWQRALTNDANWIDGCFEWYRDAGDPVGSSTDVYWNSRPGATTGYKGGHKICVAALMDSGESINGYPICQDVRGSYCADEAENGVICDRTAVDTWEKFGVYADATWPEDVVALRGGQQGRWCSDETDGVVCNRGSVGPWEKFVVERHGSGKLTLKGGHNHKYCTIACEGGRLMCIADVLGPNEQFTFVMDSAPAVNVLSATYGGNCGAEKNNQGSNLESSCNGQSTCSYRIDVTQIGDPAWGCAKGYTYSYHCGDFVRRSGEAEAEADGKTIVLDCLQL